jgi:hypothetical protein
MPGPNATQTLIIAERRRIIAARYLKGESQHQIAHDLHCTQQQISFDLRAIRALWLQATVRDFDDAKAMELAKIDLVEAEMWAGWQRSCAAREISTTKAIRGRVSREEDSLRTEQQVGDPRFLDGVLRCIERRCAILGIDALTDAMKEAGTGLAALLDAARLHTASPRLVGPPRGVPEAS